MSNVGSKTRAHAEKWGNTIQKVKHSRFAAVPPIKTEFTLLTVEQIFKAIRFHIELFCFGLIFKSS